jgi:hypothetical protein
VCALAVLTAGCGADSGGDVWLSPTVTAYDGYGLPRGVDGRTTTGGQRYLESVRAEVPRISSPEQGIGFAVQVLLESRQLSGTIESYWAGPCAPGLQPTEVDVRADLVTIRLSGTAADHRLCALSEAQRQVREQQIAWTVRAYLDPRWEQAPPIVRVVEGDGSSWTAIADPAYIAPSEHP